jgi:hypothetical protein
MFGLNWEEWDGIGNEMLGLGMEGRNGGIGRIVEGGGTKKWPSSPIFRPLYRASKRGVASRKSHPNRKNSIVGKLRQTKEFASRKRWRIGLNGIVFSEGRRMCLKGRGIWLKTGNENDE